MQRPRTKSSEIFDVAIVGAGLTGLTLALALERLGKKVILLDDGEQLGGYNVSARYENVAFTKGLRFLPDQPLARQALDYLEGLLSSEIPRHSQHNRKLSYESGEFKEFLGFGEKAPANVDELNYFFCEDELKSELPPSQWISKLLDSLTAERIHPAYVTRFHVSEGQVTHLTYNTNKDVYADQFVFCGGVKDMMPLFAREDLPLKIHQKVAKGALWSTLCLDMIHQTSAEIDSSMNVLNYGTKEEPEYFLGRFQDPSASESDTPLVISHWMALLDHEVTEDSEQVAVVLKKMKKQIKKVYPELTEAVTQERVSFMPSMLGQIDLGLKNPLQVPGINNFFLGSAQLSEAQNMVASLERSFALARHFESSVFIEEQGDSELEAPPPQLS